MRALAGAIAALALSGCASIGRVLTDDGHRTIMVTVGPVNVHAPPGSHLHVRQITAGAGASHDDCGTVIGAGVTGRDCEITTPKEDNHHE